MAYRYLKILLCLSFLAPGYLLPANKPDFKTSSSAAFIENKGQITDQHYKPIPAVLFLLNTPGFNVQLRNGGFSYDAYTTSKGNPKDEENRTNASVCSIYDHRIDIDVMNFNPGYTLETGVPSSFYLNYFTAGTPAGGITFVRSYKTITYENIYPGIDLQFRTNAETPFEYNFIVRHGADLNSIKIRISGPGQIKQHRDGIDFETSIGAIEETIPLCYYMNNNTRIVVKGRFRKIADRIYGFSVDQPLPEGSVLYIDPVPTRRWGTYYGGTGTNVAGTHGLAIDGNGNSIIVGWTTSTDNIATTGSHQVTFGGSTDGFLAKFLPDGTLLWGTYYGGTSVDEGYCCAVDKDNYIFYGGETYSTDNIATPGAFQTTLQGQPDAVLAKFSPDGILLWGTYYGGASTTAFFGQSVTSCSVDTSGNIYYAGITSSQSNIATPGAVQPNFGGGLYDIFLVCFAGDGTRIWGTYYGGTGVEENQACSVSKAGLVYLSGTTTSAGNIATPGSFMPLYTGGEKAFLACFNLDGTRKWGTYFGGEGTDVSYDCAADTGSGIYLVGATSSLTNIGTSGTFQPVISGTNNAYLEKFDSSCARTWGTYFGPATPGGAATDDSGFVYLAGNSNTLSPLNFSPDGYQTFIRGGQEAILAKFDGNGQRIWSTYYGGTGNETALSCCIDPDYNVYLMGTTNSNNNTNVSPSFCTRNHDENYIATPGSHQTEMLGITDPFLVKFSGCRSPDTASAINGPLSLCVNSAGMVYSIPPVASAGSYHWCVTGDLSVTSGQGAASVTIDAGATPGTDTISVYGINSCDTGYPLMITRRVYERPVPLISGTDTTCTGLGTLFTTAGGKTGYQWAVSPGGTIFGGGSPADSSCTIIWTSPGARWFTLNYTDTTGCDALTPVQFNVWVVQGPPVSVTITATENPVCTGIPVIFTATGVNGGISPGYQWQVNGIDMGTNNPVYSYIPVNGDVITCSFTSSGVCVSNNPAVSNAVTMIVNPNQPVSITISSSGNPVCSGTTVTFTATAINGGTNPVYQWKVNGVHVGINTNTYSYVPLSGDHIICLVTSDIICPTGNPATSNQITMTVNPDLSVSINITASANPVCSGLPATYTAAAMNGGPAPVYQWKVNGVSVGKNSTTYAYDPASGDQISCILISNITCPTGNPATSNIITMNVPASPVVTFIACNDTITTTNAQPFKLKRGIPFGGTYSGAGVTNGIFYPAIAGAGSHQITYTYTNAALCSATAPVFIHVFNPANLNCGSSFIDIRDNQVYPTVKIGSQCWMAANLNYGTEIASSQDQRDNCQPEHYCYKDDPVNCNTYGGLYQWDELMQYDNTSAVQGLCPPGWRIPAEADWNALFSNYINNAFAASPLLFSGFSGFNALLSGARHINESWDFQNFATFFWSSTANGVNKAWSHGMNNVDPSVSVYPSFRNNAFPVRCLKN